MKKCLMAILALTIVTTVTSTVSVGLSQQCNKTINAAAQELEHKSFQQVLKDRMWDNFKKDARSKGKWGGIVRACYSPKPGYKCMGCQCGENDDCTSHCLCCWGDKRC